MKFNLILIISTFEQYFAKVDPVLFCDVCRAVIAETRNFAAQVPLHRKIKIVEGQGRLSGTGNLKTKAKYIPESQSRDWLEEIWEEKVCHQVASDYVKWFGGTGHKQWRIGRVMTWSGSMNTNIDLAYLQQGQGEAREVIEKDPSARSRSLRWYCENAIEYMEDELYKSFMQDKTGKIDVNPTKTICVQSMKWCGGELSNEDFTSEMFDKEVAKHNKKSSKKVEKVKPIVNDIPDEYEIPDEKLNETGIPSATKTASGKIGSESGAKGKDIPRNPDANADIDNELDHGQSDEESNFGDKSEL